MTKNQTNTAHLFCLALYLWYIPDVHNVFGPKPQSIIFSALKSQGQNYDEKECQNAVCDLILLPSELFRIVIRYKIVYNSFIKSPSFRRSLLYIISCCEGWI